MPIDPTNTSKPISPRSLSTGKDSEVRSARNGSAESSPRTTSPESTRFTRAAKADNSQDINTARVAEIRQGIADGSLKFDSGRIADGIIRSARELTGQD